MNNIRVETHSSPKNPRLKTWVWIGILGFLLCLLLSLLIFGSLARGAVSTAKLDGPACPSGISPPTNAKIAFASNRNSKLAGVNSDIYIINTDGSGQTQLTDSSDLLDAYFPAWSTDGTKLFLYSFAKGEYFVMGADGSGLTRVSKDEAPGVLSGLSPDGKLRLFVENDDIYVMNADGSGRKKLTSHANDRVNSAPAWSPDGSIIAFRDYRPGGSEDITPPYDHLITIRPDGTALRDLNDDAISFAWSPDGRRIAVVRRDYHLYVLDSDGTGLTRITSLLSTASIDAPFAITWSPDSEWIAFQGSDTSGHISSIAIIKSTCLGNIWWLPNTTYSSEPAWQPAQK